MTIRADMQTALAQVLTAFGEGEAWTYAPLSSEPGVQPPTFGSTVSFTTAKTVSRNVGEEWDEISHTYKRMERLVLATTGITMVASQGDRISDGTNSWRIESFILGYALSHWTLTRDLPLLQSREAQRGV